MNLERLADYAFKGYVAKKLTDIDRKQVETPMQRIAREQREREREEREKEAMKAQQQTQQAVQEMGAENARDRRDSAELATLLQEYFELGQQDELTANKNAVGLYFRLLRYFRSTILPANKEKAGQYLEQLKPVVNRYKTDNIQELRGLAEKWLAATRPLRVHETISDVFSASAYVEALAGVRFPERLEAFLPEILELAEEDKRRLLFYGRLTEDDFINLAQLLMQPSSFKSLQDAVASLGSLIPSFPAHRAEDKNFDKEFLQRICIGLKAEPQDRDIPSRMATYLYNSFSERLPLTHDALVGMIVFAFQEKFSDSCADSSHYKLLLGILMSGEFFKKWEDWFQALLWRIGAIDVTLTPIGGDDAQLRKLASCPFLNTDSARDAQLETEAKTDQSVHNAPSAPNNPSEPTRAKKKEAAFLSRGLRVIGTCLSWFFGAVVGIAAIAALFDAKLFAGAISFVVAPLFSPPLSAKLRLPWWSKPMLFFIWVYIFFAML